MSISKAFRSYNKSHLLLTLFHSNSYFPGPTGSLAPTENNRKRNHEEALESGFEHDDTGPVDSARPV
jgi:hypothetical protein